MTGSSLRRHSPDRALGTNGWALLVEVLRQTLARSNMSAPPDPAQVPTPRLASDFRRLLFSVAIGAPATAVAEGLYLAISGNGLSAVAVVVAAYIFSAASSLAYFITTFAIFQNADADSLARWVAATAPTGRLSRLQAEFAGTGPTISVQWSGLAIVSVVVLALSPDLLKQPLVIALSVAVVTTSWLVTIASYAVHYARVTATVGGLTFPGTGGVVFWDCVYLATQVQAHFLILRRLRRNNPGPQNRHRSHTRRIRLQHGHHRPAHIRTLPWPQVRRRSQSGSH
jgi:hypothetical protein